MSQKISKINNIIYGNEEFLYNRSNISTLNILFHRLLVIDPKDKMTFDEFFDFVFKEGFMEEGVIFPKYKSLYEKILKEKIVKYMQPYIVEEEGFKDYIEMKNKDTFLSLVECKILPDIMSFSNENINGKKLFNNIIYYDENLKYLQSINQDIYLFERITPGSFIFCTSLESLELIRKDIVKQNKRNKRITFNIITTGSKCETIIEFLNKNIDFKGCIKNICVYSFNKEKWGYIKNKYEIVHNVVTNKKDVIKFIDEFSLEEIKPYPVKKILTYKDYQDKY